MIKTIEYPENPIEWYAKGTTDTGGYFEIPAVFNEDSTCNVEATDVKVEEALILIQKQLEMRSTVKDKL